MPESTRKQREAYRRALQPYVETGDMLGAYLVSRVLQRDMEEAGDVFGNRCRCRLNDDGEWVDAFCPEHGEDADA